VSVALVRNHDLVGTRTFDRGGRCRRASMRHLHVADVEVVIGKYRATDWADEDRLVLQAEFFERFGNQLVRYAMAAARAVVGLVFQFCVAIIEVIEHRRLLMDDLVRVGFRLRYCALRLVSHCLLLTPMPPCVPLPARAALQPTERSRRPGHRIPPEPS